MGLNTSFEKLGFQYQVFNKSFDTQEQQIVFNFQQFLILSFVFVQASAVKPGICNLFLSYSFLIRDHPV